MGNEENKNDENIIHNENEGIIIPFYDDEDKNK